MAVSDAQDNLIKAIETVVDIKLNAYKNPSNTVGIVVSEPSGFECIVEINKEQINCLLPEHLQTWVQKDDIVSVQDLYGNGQRLMVIGKTGKKGGDPSIVFSRDDKNISGVDGAFTEEGRIGTTGTVVIE